MSGDPSMLGIAATMEIEGKVWYYTEDDYKYTITLSTLYGSSLSVSRKKTDTIPDF